MRVGLVVAALCLAGPARAAPVDDMAAGHTSFYVLGDSLSDDGNLPGPAWFLATGGDPYEGGFFSGGVFTDGAVWNEPFTGAFRNAGRDAENFAVAGARASGGGLLPDLDRQIDTLLRGTDARDRGPDPLVSIWTGANDLIGAIGSGDVRGAARAAANEVAAGARRLADAAGVGDFVVFNMPNLARIPKFNLFERDLRPEARRAAKVYNRRLAKRAAGLAAEGLVVHEVDVFGLVEDARRDPAAFGLVDVVLPCVFPSEAEARAFGEPERCDDPEGRLFIDDLHPTARAHGAVADLAAGTILGGAGPLAAVASAGAAAPAPVPLPGGAWSLAAAMAGLGLVGRAAGRRRRGRAGRDRHETLACHLSPRRPSSPPKDQGGSPCSFASPPLRWRSLRPPRRCRSRTSSPATTCSATP